MYWENKYCKLLLDIVEDSYAKEARNAHTFSKHGVKFSVCMRDRNFPLLQGRKMYPKGILGELATFLQGFNKVEDFKKNGCNYWDVWGDKDGKLNLDYGNSWIDFNKVNQIQTVIDTLKTDPYSRRMIITGWRPDRLKDLSLPCCHILYQWLVSSYKYLDMIIYQRSADMMVGFPSDLVLAAAWNVLMAKLTGLKPGTVTFMIGDAHIYYPHIQGGNFYKYIARAKDKHFYPVDYTIKDIDDYRDFKSDTIKLIEYDNKPLDLKFELIK